MADNLREILDIAKRECPEIPEAALARIDLAIRIAFGGQRLYIANQKKRARLAMLAELNEQQDAARIAEVLGVSVRRVQQLKKII